MLATAVESEAFRTALRDDFRASPYSEHKLLLSRAFGEGGGNARLLLQATDAALLDSLVAVASEAPIELYIPGSAARRSWRPSQSLSVYAYGGRNSTVASRLTAAGGIATVPVSNIVYEPMLLVAPAEQMARRLHSGAVSSEFIEGSNEPQLGSLRLVRTPFGLREPALASQPFARLEACEDWTCDPGGGGGAPQDTTFLNNLLVFDVVDNGMPWTDNEFEWRALYTVGGVPTDYSVLRLTGIPKDHIAIYHDVLITRKPSSTTGAVIYVNVVETDTFGDDTFGPTIVLSDPTNYLPAPLYHAGADRCAYALANFGLPCVSGGVQYKETNQSFYYN